MLSQNFLSFKMSVTYERQPNQVENIHFSNLIYREVFSGIFQIFIQQTMTSNPTYDRRKIHA